MDTQVDNGPSSERVNDFETPTGLHLLSDLDEFRL
jgi:hypothetical protein